MYYNAKKKLYLRASFFWLALIVNFLVQSVAQGNETAIIMGYGFSVLPLNLLCYASAFFIKTRYPWKRFATLALLSLTASLLLLKQTETSFFLKALPLSIATAAPLIYIAFLFLVTKRRESTNLMKTHSIVLLCLSVHCFNFAVFRNNPSAQLWGWPVSYAIYQLLAAIIPAMSIDFYHREEKVRLEGIIDERTKDLHEANGFLKAAAKEKDFLFKTLVHDVSNPLSVIMGRLKIYEKNKDIEKFVSSVDKMTHRISSLISQVQAFEQATNESNGKIDLEPIKLKSSFIDIISMFEDKLSDKNINLDYDLNSFENITLYSERKILSNSIIPNIINNAIKFSHENSSIKIQAHMNDKNSCTLSITDYGIGIPQKTLDKIFDFESQTSRPGTKGEKGTGFGLPIIKKLIDKSDGKLWVESREENETRSGETTVSISFKATLSST